MDLHGDDGLALTEHSECVSLLYKKYLLSAVQKEEVSLFSLFKCFSFLEAAHWLDFSLCYSSSLGEQSQSGVSRADLPW